MALLFNFAASVSSQSNSSIIMRMRTSQTCVRGKASQQTKQEVGVVNTSSSHRKLRPLTITHLPMPSLLAVIAKDVGRHGNEVTALLSWLVSPSPPRGQYSHQDFDTICFQFNFLINRIKIFHQLVNHCSLPFSDCCVFEILFDRQLQDFGARSKAEND